MKGNVFLLLSSKHRGKGLTNCYRTLSHVCRLSHLDVCILTSRIIVFLGINVVRQCNSVWLVSYIKEYSRLQTGFLFLSCRLQQSHIYRPTTQRTDISIFELLKEANRSSFASVVAFVEPKGETKIALNLFPPSISDNKATHPRVRFLMSSVWQLGERRVLEEGGKWG